MSDLKRRTASDTPSDIDPWSFLDFKEAFRTETNKSRSSWVPKHERRRLAAYHVLISYYRNRAADWLNSDAELEDRKEKREYGDPLLLREQALASLLGVSQKLRVRPYPDQEVPSIDEFGEPMLDAEGQPITEFVSDDYADEIQSLIDDWAEKESFIHKLIESERNSTGLGDGIYTLGWSVNKGRPRLTVWDPGFYFPDWTSLHLSEDDFPTRVCIAYEYQDDQTEEIMVRRIMWELVSEEIRPYDLPWRPKCTEDVFMIDAVWKMESIGEYNLFDFPADQAHEIFTNTWLGIDFIPVVHVTNNVAGAEFYGTPVIAPALQVLDDLSSGDTDLQSTAAISASPPLAVKGAVLAKDDNGKRMTYGPGEILETGDGDASFLSTADNLTALIAFKNEMQERVSVTARTPESLLGRVKPNEVPSGIALTLSFAPHATLISEMRLVRSNKYPILMKMVQRFFMKAGVLADSRPVNLEFGSFLPADKSEVSSTVVNLLGSQAISLETAVTMLMVAGLPIESVLEEVSRIRSVDYVNAMSAGDATGDPNEARRYLGLPPIEFPQPTDSGEETL